VTITWSSLAVDRIIEISRDIASENLAAAETWVVDLFARVDRLRSFPESGRVIRELPRGPYRQILHENYRVIYRIEGPRVIVLTVRHGRRLLDFGELR
jgi:plasmid stabilization system protein ParE